MFKAAALLTPFYKLHNEKVYNSLPLVRVMNFFYPNF